MKRSRSKIRTVGCSPLTINCFANLVSFCSKSPGVKPETSIFPIATINIFPSGSTSYDWLISFWPGISISKMSPADKEISFWAVSGVLVGMSLSVIFWAGFLAPFCCSSLSLNSFSKAKLLVSVLGALVSDKVIGFDSDAGF